MRLLWTLEAPGIPGHWTALMQTAADACLWAEGVNFPCAAGAMLLPRQDAA